MMHETRPPTDKEKELMDMYLEAVRRRDFFENERRTLGQTIFDLVTDGPMGIEGARVVHAGRIWQPRSNMEWSYSDTEAKLREKRNALTKELTKLRKQEQKSGEASWTGAVKQFIIPEQTEK